MIIEKESHTGADCTGSSGEKDRVLTLNNTQETRETAFLVYVDGLALTVSEDYTANHKSSGTEITFLNKLWDDMDIVVQYWRRPTTTYETARDDIQSIILNKGGTFVLRRQTETTDGMGSTTSVSEETYNIIVLIQDITQNDRQIREMGLAKPGNSKAYFYHEYKDAITGNGDLEVKTGDILEKDGQYWRIEEITATRRTENYPIFKVGVIRKVDLDET